MEIMSLSTGVSRFPKSLLAYANVNASFL